MNFFAEKNTTKRRRILYRNIFAEAKFLKFKRLLHASASAPSTRRAPHLSCQQAAQAPMVSLARGSPGPLLEALSQRLLEGAPGASPRQSV